MTAEKIICFDWLRFFYISANRTERKQLGFDEYPAYTYRVAEMLKEPTEKVWGYPYADIVMGCQMANPTSVFRAMVSEQPYPVKAFFVLGSNALLSYPNQNQILKGLMNQELIVAHEIFMTPTAMLADYVLPGDVFTERNHIADSWSWSTRLSLSQKAVEPPEQASSTFQFWKTLRIEWASAMNFPGKHLRTFWTTDFHVLAERSRNLKRRELSRRHHPNTGSIAKPVLRPHLVKLSSIQVF